MKWGDGSRSAMKNSLPAFRNLTEPNDAFFRVFGDEKKKMVVWKKKKKSNWGTIILLKEEQMLKWKAFLFPQLGPEFSSTDGGSASIEVTNSNLLCWHFFFFCFLKSGWPMFFFLRQITCQVHRLSIRMKKNRLHSPKYTQKVLVFQEFTYLCIYRWVL